MKILLSVVLVVFLSISTYFTVDESAMKLHQESFERAMVSFALAKGLNGVISLIQGTELSFTPVGVGLNFSVGEILDPFNDMVERFSWVMLLASISLGIQKLLLLLSAKIFLQIAIGVSVAVSLFLLWQRKIKNQTYLIVSLKILALLLIFRFGAIVSVYTTQLVYDSLLHNEYTESTLVIKETEQKLQDVQKQNSSIVQEKKQTAWYNLDVTSKYENVKSFFDISTKLEELSVSIDEASRKIISLITVFVVQTLLLPLLFLYFIVALIRFILGVRISALQAHLHH